MKQNDYLLKRVEDTIDELIRLTYLLSSKSSNNPEQMVVDSFDLHYLSEQQKKLKKALRRRKYNLSLIKDIVMSIITKAVIIIVEKISTTSLYKLRSNYSEERKITAMKIGNSIKFVRVTKNISQKDLAKKLKISQNYLSLIENDRKEPSLTLLKKISNALGVPMSALIIDFDNKNKEQQELILKIRDLIIQLESLNDEIGDE